MAKLNSEIEHVIMQLMAEGFIVPEKVADAVDSVVYNRLHCYTCGMRKDPEEFNTSGSMAYVKRGFRQRYCKSCVASRLAAVKVVDPEEFNSRVTEMYLDEAISNNVSPEGILLPSYLWAQKISSTDLQPLPEINKSTPVIKENELQITERPTRVRRWEGRTPPQETDKTDELESPVVIPPMPKKLPAEVEDYDPEDYEADDEGIPDLPIEDDEDAE